MATAVIENFPNPIKMWWLLFVVFSRDFATSMSYPQLDCGIVQTYMFHALMAKSFVMLDGNVDFLLQDYDVSKKKLKVISDC